MNIKGTQTEKILFKTFAGECRARTKYDLYAEEAICNGYRWIAEIFMEIANNEKAHAREVFKRYLCKVGDTEENLLEAARGEAEEANKVYKEFEEIARSEGFHEIADFYKELQEVEEAHWKRYSILAEKVNKDKVFKSSSKKLWQCMNCGYIYEGEEAPEMCPLCKYPKSYFKPYCKLD